MSFIMLCQWRLQIQILSNLNTWAIRWAIFDQQLNRNENNPRNISTKFGFRKAEMWNGNKQHTQNAD
jgi:hypothetical protein